MCGKFKKLAQRVIGKLHPSNLVNTIFWKKLFAIEFPYKHAGVENRDKVYFFPDFNTAPVSAG